jgi:hypothetical protein
MDFDSLIPIVAIVATAWVLVTLMRMRQRGHGGGTQGVAEAKENASGWRK